MISEDAGTEIITTSAAYQPWEAVFDESAILVALTGRQWLELYS
jgi:hypothetical protein